MTPLIKSTIKWLDDIDFDITDTQWFDVSGTLDESTVDQNWLRDYRPPFEKCIVVWQGKTKNHEVYEMVMVTVGDSPENGIVLGVYKGPFGRMPRKLPLMVYALDDGMVKYGPLKEEDKIDQKDAEMVLGFVGNWYRLLSERCQSYKPVVRDTFTNRRKMAQGKIPTYDWTTVYIEPAKPRADSKGGTHASPRQHDRRGHLRRLRSGKNVWVKAHKVGDASKGIVWHDYEVRAA